MKFDPTSLDRMYHPVGKKSNCGTIVFVAIIIIAIVTFILIIISMGGIAYIFNNWPEIWAGIKAFFAQ